MVKKSLLKRIENFLVSCSLYKAFFDIVFIKQFILDSYSLISCLAVSTNRFTQECYHFQSHSNIFFYFLSIL